MMTSAPYPSGKTTSEKYSRIKLAILAARKAQWDGLTIIELRGNWLRYRLFETGVHQITWCQNCDRILRSHGKARHTA